MITDIEEESKTKFSMGVEFTFLLKEIRKGLSEKVNSACKVKFHTED